MQKRPGDTCGSLIISEIEMVSHVHEEACALHARVLPRGDRLSPRSGSVPGALCAGKEERYDGWPDPGPPIF